MVKINLSFKTKSGKNLEFMQTIGSIIVDLRRIQGCVGVDLQQDDQYKDQFNLGIDLQNREYIESLLGSKEFDFFQGAVKVLCTPPMVEINDGSKEIKIDTNDNPQISMSKQIITKFRV